LKKKKDIREYDYYKIIKNEKYHEEDQKKS